MLRRLPLGAVFVACVVARVEPDQAAELLRASLEPETTPPVRRPPRGVSVRAARRPRRARRGECAARRRRR